LAGSALGADYDWVGASGNWSVNTNWDPSVVPTGTDNATFTGGTNTVTVDASTAINDMAVSSSYTFDGSTTVLTLNGTYSQTSGTAVLGLDLDLAGAGNVSVTGGSLEMKGANSLTGSVSVANANLTLDNPGAITNTSGITVGGGATLVQHMASGSTWDSGTVDMLDGAKFRYTTWYNYANSSDADWTLTGDCTWAGYGGGTNHISNMSGSITGSGKLIFDASNGGATTTDSGCVKLTNAGNTWSGGTHIRSGSLYILADGAIGSGPLTIESGAGGPVFTVDQTVNPPSSITVQPGGVVSMNSTTFSPSMTFNDGAYLSGKLVNSTYSGVSRANVDMTGTLTLDGVMNVKQDSGYLTSNSLTVSGQIVDGTGSGKIVKGEGSQYLTLSNTGNSYSGGTDVLAGRLTVAGAGALGSGNVHVASGGTLRTTADGALDSVLVAGGNSVVIDAGGTLDFGSTELAGGGTLTVKTHGAVMRSGGSTDFGNITDLWSGAILHNSITSGLPTQAQVAALPNGDGRYGLYYGVTSTLTGNFTNAGNNAFGEGASGSIFRGPAVIGGATAKMRGTFEEVTGGTDGISVYVAPGCTLQLGVYQPADFDTPNTLRIEGGGNVELHTHCATSNFGANWEHNAIGRVYMRAGSVIGAGTTLNMNKGYLTSYTSVSAERGKEIAGTVHFRDKGIWFPHGSYSHDTGTVRFSDGGAMILHNSNTMNGTITMDIAEGTHCVLRDYSWTDAAPPGPGLCDYSITYTTHRFEEGGMEMQLGNNTSVMNGISTNGTPLNSRGINTNYGNDGNLLLAAGHTQGKVAAIRGTNFTIWTAINFGTGTLLVNDPDNGSGDPDLYSLPNEAYASGQKPPFWSDVHRDGEVRLNNTHPTDASVIGAIKINSGMLRIEDGDDVGGAATIELAGGKLYAYNNAIMGSMITGNGEAEVRSGRRYTFTAGGGISAGNSVGQIDITGSVTFDGGALDVEIEGSGNVGGTDHDYVTVSGNATLTDGVLAVTIGAPKDGLEPDLLDAIVLTAGSLTNTFTTVSVSSPAPLNPGVSAALVAAHYDLSAAVDYSSGTDVAIDGSGGIWLGASGDATLDDKVNIFDLVALANNYNVPGPKDVTLADFDLDGVVGIFDLVALANNYGYGTGGAPVPEPMTLGLLAVGGLLVLHRRRR